MRVRLLIAAGIVLVTAGLIVGALTIRWTFGTHIFDPAGPVATLMTLVPFIVCASLAAVLLGVCAIAGVLMRRRSAR